MPGLEVRPPLRGCASTSGSSELVSRPTTCAPGLALADNSPKGGRSSSPGICGSSRTSVRTRCASKAKRGRRGHPRSSWSTGSGSGPAALLDRPVHGHDPGCMDGRVDAQGSRGLSLVSLLRRLHPWRGGLCAGCPGRGMRALAAVARRLLAATTFSNRRGGSSPFLASYAPTRRMTFATGDETEPVRGTGLGTPSEAKPAKAGARSSSPGVCRGG